MHPNLSLLAAVGAIFLLTSPFAGSLAHDGLSNIAALQRQNNARDHTIGNQPTENALYSGSKLPRTPGIVAVKPRPKPKPKTGGSPKTVHNPAAGRPKKCPRGLVFTRVDRRCDDATPTIENQGYERKLDEDDMIPEFMAPYLTRRGGRWLHQKIMDGDRTVCMYAMHSQGDAYLTKFVATFNTPGNKNAMKYRDIMFDNLKAEGEEHYVKSIGTDLITHAAARNAIENGFNAQGKNFRGGDKAEFTPGGPGWNELITGNPFAIGPLKMVEERGNEMGNPWIESIIAIAKPNPQNPNIPTLYMVTRLKRPDEV